MKNVFLVLLIFLPIISFGKNKIVELDSTILEEFEWIVSDSNKIYGIVDTFKSNMLRNYYNKEMISNENVLFVFDEKENLLSLEFDKSLVKQFIFMGFEYESRKSKKTVKGYVDLDNPETEVKIFYYITNNKKEIYKIMFITDTDVVVYTYE